MKFLQFLKEIFEFIINDIKQIFNISSKDPVRIWKILLYLSFILFLVQLFSGFRISFFSFPSEIEKKQEEMLR